MKSTDAQYIPMLSMDLQKCDKEDHCAITSIERTVPAPTTRVVKQQRNTITDAFLLNLDKF